MEKPFVKPVAVVCAWSDQISGYLLTLFALIEKSNKAQIAECARLLALVGVLGNVVSGLGEERH